jgi:WD40 repeat protein
VLSWSEDRTLRLWDLDGGRELQVLRGHEGRVEGVLLADGRRALSWSEDRTLGLWDLERGTELGNYFADAEISAATVDAVHGKIFAGDSMGRIHIVRFRTDGGGGGETNASSVSDGK